MTIETRADRNQAAEGIHSNSDRASIDILPHCTDEHGDRSGAQPALFGRGRVGGAGLWIGNRAGAPAAEDLHAGP